MRALRSSALACGILLAACSEQPSPSTADPALAQAEATPPAADGAPTASRAPSDLQPRGLVVNEPGASPGYVLFNPLLSDTAYLVDNEGAVVHTWKSDYSPGGAMELLPDGRLLRMGRDPNLQAFRTGGTSGILQELDWDGTVLWEWRLSDEQHVTHHDHEPLPNGNVLLLAWESKSPDEVQRAGRRADTIPKQGLWPDWVLEIEPRREEPWGADIVWEWHVWDHLVQDHDPEAPSHADPATRPSRIDLNATAAADPLGADELAQLQALGYVAPGASTEDLQSDFLHVNAVAHHPRLDQIALSVPTVGEIWIIDHAISTEEARGPAGDLLYRWGNPAAYQRGGTEDQRFFYQHDVRWIPDGWEGAGNLTVFNNGRERPEGPFSSIEEWTPPLDADGRYAPPGAGGFAPRTLAWEYKAEEPTDFFAPFISGAHRLANGNTLICSGTGGRVFEVDRGGRIVWEYRNPFSGSMRNADGSMPQPGLDQSPYALFRAARIPADHPALSGRSLAPLDPQPAWHEVDQGEGR